MEIVAELINNKLALLVVPVVVSLFALVFAFGFKSVAQPKFAKAVAASGDDKKGASKKKKPKEKKSTSNGHVVTDKATPLKEKRSPAKETPNKQAKKQENNKQAERSKKHKKVGSEKPLDYDDGEWETVPTKADKKKKLESPAKKDKKKPATTVEIDKLAKEVVNKELREKNKKEREEVAKVEAPVVVVAEEAVLAVEERKEKKREKKPKKEEDKKASVALAPASAPIPKAAAAVEPEKKEKKVIEAAREPAAPAKSENAPVFDELGDTWSEPKAKKSKKKARRDN